MALLTPTAVLIFHISCVLFAKDNYFNVFRSFLLFICKSFFIIIMFKRFNVLHAHSNYRTPRDLADTHSNSERIFWVRERRDVVICLGIERV